VAPKRKPVVNEAEEVSRLIGDIYDASLDPSLWSTVFAAATKYIGGSAATSVRGTWLEEVHTAISRPATIHVSSRSITKNISG
jgi:hypothetical protein